MEVHMSKTVLGRGLSTLIPQRVEEQEVENQSGIMEIEVGKIQRSKLQPRVVFNEEKQRELVNSIREKGLIQPIVVRKVDEGFEIIAGERRYRAAKMLGMEKILVIIKSFSDVEALEVSLIENLQRDNLNPIEEAKGYKRLSEDFQLTQEDIAKKVGKDRTTVTNSIRLLNLSVDIQYKLGSGKITTGHAKVLLSIDNETEQRKIVERIVNEGLSVRETERCIADIKESPVHKKKMSYKDPHLVDIEEHIQRVLGTQVKICQGKKKGRIEIEYYNHEDLDRILEFFGIEEEKPLVNS